MNVGIWLGSGIALLALAIAILFLVEEHRPGEGGTYKTNISDWYGSGVVLALFTIGAAIFSVVAYAQRFQPNTTVLRGNEMIAKVRIATLEAQTRFDAAEALLNVSGPPTSRLVLSPFPGCPPAGDTAEARIQKLNKLKNRAVTPSSIDSHITLRKILRKGNDEHRWSDSDGATIRGWVIVVKPGGSESVNCHASSPKHRDTHIMLALSPNASKDQAMVVEVTPFWRAKKAAVDGKDWSTHRLEKELKGHYIQITGWMFFDAEHKNAAENTEPGSKHDWRATAWEIHPVTAIKILE